LVPLLVLSSVVFVVVQGEEEVWEEDDSEVLIRPERGIKKQKGDCRYKKGPWSECDNKLVTRSRTLTLKRGDSSCEQTKTIQKKCKKACRYEKGPFGPCDPTTNQRTRMDKLKPMSDPSCEQTRQLTHKCEGRNTADKIKEKRRRNKKNKKNQQE